MDTAPIPVKKATPAKATPAKAKADSEEDDNEEDDDEDEDDEEDEDEEDAEEESEDESELHVFGCITNRRKDTCVNLSSCHGLLGLRNSCPSVRRRACVLLVQRFMLLY